MERTISEAAGRINGTYGEVAWTPIRYVNRAYSRSALAGLYRSARVGLVTPLRDGMNRGQGISPPRMRPIPAFSCCRASPGRRRNAAPRSWSILTIPRRWRSIAHALSMPLEERRERHAALFRVISDNDIYWWGEHFLAALTADTGPALARAAQRRTAALFRIA